MSEKRISSAFAIACTLVAGAALSPAMAADADGKSRAVVVLDASGSMWATIGGRSRIEIARGALGELLRGWDPKIEIGLVAYGHRKKGDCGDIELLAPVARARQRKPASSFSATSNPTT